MQNVAGLVDLQYGVWRYAPDEIIVEFPVHLTNTQQHDGEAGVDLMLNILHDEFKRTMQLTGCRTIADISKASLGIVRADGPLARL